MNVQFLYFAAPALISIAFVGARFLADGVKGR